MGAGEDAAGGVGGCGISQELKGSDMDKVSAENLLSGG